MEKLNLPEADLKVARRDGRLVVFDPLRRRFVTLTPEEWVRQHFVHFLITQKNYPAGVVANEVSITFNGMTRRRDTVGYGRHAAADSGIQSANGGDFAADIRPD